MAVVKNKIGKWEIEINLHDESGNRKKLTYKRDDEGNAFESKDDAFRYSKVLEERLGIKDPREQE